MRRAARVDANQAEIVKALRAAGATVQHLHVIGKGCPDLLVGFRETNYLLEVKDAGGMLTDDEQIWRVEWRGPLVAVVYSVDDALKAIGAV